MSLAPAEIRLDHFGGILKAWRQTRHLSQLELALRAGVSARHVSFVETGRSGASTEMVLRLADALDVPLRDRNLLLLAAGHAPAYRESALDSSALRDVRRALELILRRHEPFAAWALDARWHLVMLNGPAAQGFSDWMGRTLPSLAVLASPGPDLLELLATAGRSHVVNWSAVMAATLRRAERDALWHRDERLGERVRTLSHRTGIAARGGAGEVERPSEPFIPIETRGPDGQVLRFFNTLTTLGAPQDVMLQELRVEAMHPADAATEAAATMAVGAHPARRGAPPAARSPVREERAPGGRKR
jgi:transcriptional regulator with XRE-family HTH domain